MRKPRLYGLRLCLYSVALIACSESDPGAGTGPGADAATPAGCTKDGTHCDDGNPCTYQDLCMGGLCYGTVYQCDDGLACTADQCNGDGSCTNAVEPPRCLIDGACVDEGATASGQPCLVCKPGASNSAWTPLSGEACDDGDPCTSGDLCEAGFCTGLAMACDDGLACTMDSCQNGGCRHEALPGRCVIAGECYEAGEHPAGGDGWQCLACRPDVLADAWTAVEGLCGSGNPCTDHRHCVSGECVPVGVPYCSGAWDGPCRKNTCDPALGACVMQDLPDGSGCEDGNPCTKGDECEDGQCVAGKNACECSKTPDCAVHEDADLCNGTLVCSAGFECVVDPSTVVVCDASKDTACKKAACVPDLGVCAMSSLPNGTGCDDGDLCTNGDTCKGGVCTGVGKSCDDGNQCTTDGCDAAGKCVNTPITGPCNDGDACTGGDACKDGKCQGAPIDCDDGNPCTADGCSKATGCVNTPLTGACNDGDPCTLDDVCHGVVCGGAKKPCSDGDPCTTDGCDSTSGACFNEPIPDCTPPGKAPPFTLQDLNPHSPTFQKMVSPMTDYAGYVILFSFQLFH